MIPRIVHGTIRYHNLELIGLGHRVLGTKHNLSGTVLFFFCVNVFPGAAST